MQDLLGYFVPWAAASVAPDGLQRATCASTQQAHPKLQNEAEGAGVHDVGGDDEADSVVGDDTVDWIEVQLLLEASLIPPSVSLLCGAVLCWNT